MEININKVDTSIRQKIKHKIDNLTKPLGALGKLEAIALKICEIQNTLSPQLHNPTIFVIAGDHGAARKGISPYPQEVTYQMVMNFLAGGAGINVFARQNGIDVKIVDAGVNFSFASNENLIDAKINYGTKSFLTETAMTVEECESAMNKGAELVQEVFNNNCNIVGFGEMGIGNTSSASLILSRITGTQLEDCIGPGAGFDDEGVKKKIQLLKTANNKFSLTNKPLEILQHFGGFEIAMICGGMLKAAELGMVIMVDGFIITSALLVAQAIDVNVLDYCIFMHRSDEQGHNKMLDYLGADTVLNLNMRLGEGTGVAVAYPVLESAVNMINQMASFESASVSKKNDQTV